MRWGFRRFSRGSGAARDLGVYDVAFLAGGPQRVADSAIIALNRRGLVVVLASRVRAVDGEHPEHAVERAVLVFCRRSKVINAVRAAVQRSPEVEEIGRRLAARGLVAGSRRRVTRAGRRHLQAARDDASVPQYVLGGATISRDGTVRHRGGHAQTLPAGLGRTLRRMGKALDNDSDPGSDAGTYAGSGSSCGGGGGGGGD
ncbi:TIGR04222 domain-containing membrane protein [Streptomyces sp. YC504]|uniref:TIGR04222 domain-containing membrane protein n=2 Tax=Streptomyces mesophilus TaxID=1775132 RepID=A0A6G4XDD4_9ACTN|nr:TIGR04222 domain-containing membrane protein [Streptomyces mesophilus]